jgi:hypothetical protein
MEPLLLLLSASAAYPLLRAWQGSRHTSLRHAVAWAALAWAGWLILAALAMCAADASAARYTALCLTGCAAVAVLGARRPGVGAWNFVLLGLLTVMLLPLAELLVVGAKSLDPIRVVFLCATLAVGVLNYLPTRLAAAAVLLAAGCAAETALLLTPDGHVGRLECSTGSGRLCLALSPWAAFAGLRRRGAVSDAGRLWLDFRDRFGLVWGQRLREQFNHAAANAGRPLYLAWRGIRSTAGGQPSDEETEAAGEILRALLRRFQTVAAESP